jgi:hypothetical protein
MDETDRLREIDEPPDFALRNVAVVSEDDAMGAIGVIDPEDNTLAWKRLDNMELGGAMPEAIRRAYSLLLPTGGTE